MRPPLSTHPQAGRVQRAPRKPFSLRSGVRTDPRVLGGHADGLSRLRSPETPDPAAVPATLPLPTYLACSAKIQEQAPSHASGSGAGSQARRLQSALAGSPARGLLHRAFPQFLNPGGEAGQHRGRQAKEEGISGRKPGWAVRPGRGYPRQGAQYWGSGRGDTRRARGAAP